ncbi:COP9 signalosome complex subunit 1 [Irineochytrium annulatum]|nr:COP9 signalosome complex subunit 1 [Irineochytrium annulatum]
MEIEMLDSPAPPPAEAIQGEVVAPKKKRTSRTLIGEVSLDLETYISNYSGNTKVKRLEFIADVCPSLTVDALRTAIEDVKSKGMNHVKYSQLCNKLNDALASRGQQPLPLDSSWVEVTQMNARKKTEKLENELKGYKNNSIKESIRMGFLDLGAHYSSIGELQNALKSYSRTRDYCATSKHIVDMCMNVIRTSLEIGNFAHVQSYVAKAESTADLPDKNMITGKLKCCSGLVNLEQGKYKLAARNFIETTFEVGNNFSEAKFVSYIAKVISANDIAIYGGLCALASFERGELKSKVFDNADFKQYLEVEPQIRELLYSFYNCKYGACLDLLHKMKNDLLLDMYLHVHVDQICKDIRQRALIQYFGPFISVDIKKMAAAFNTTVAELEPELAQLIIGNHIQARIDSHNKVLRSKQSDKRSQVFGSSLTMGSEYQKQSKFLLLRISLSRQDMVVQPEREQQGGGMNAIEQRYNVLMQQGFDVAQLFINDIQTQPPVHYERRLTDLVDGEENAPSLDMVTFKCRREMAEILDAMEALVAQMRTRLKKGDEMLETYEADILLRRAIWKSAFMMDDRRQGMVLLSAWLYNLE